MRDEPFLPTDHHPRYARAVDRLIPVCVSCGGRLARHALKHSNLYAERGFALSGAEIAFHLGNQFPIVVRRNIIISDELDRAIDAAARHPGLKRSAIAGKALSFYLDYLDLETAIERARMYETGEDKGLSAEQLRTELGL